MLSVKKELVEKYLGPFVYPLEKVNPNTLTLLGSIPSLLFFVFLINHWYFWAIVAFIGSIFDMLDGLVAKKFHKVTNFGGFLDSTMDRVADFFIIMAFSFAHLVRFEITLPFLLFSFLTSYIRSRGELAKPGVSFAVGLIERTERLILTILSLIIYLIFPNIKLGIFNLAEVSFLILVVLSFYTVLQRINYAYKKL